MSRNYELLRLLHRERELFQRAIAPDTADAHKEEVSRLTQIEKRLFEDSGSSTGALTAPESQRAAGFARGETCKLAQRIFLDAGSTAARAVVFSPVEQNNEHHRIAAQVADRLRGLHRDEEDDRGRSAAAEGAPDLQARRRALPEVLCA